MDEGNQLERYNIRRVDDYLYSYTYNKMDVTIVGNSPTEELITYANNLVNIFLKNREAISGYIYDKMTRLGKLSNMSKEEFMILLKKPFVHAYLEDAGCYYFARTRLNANITVNLEGYKLTEVTIDDKNM